MILSIAMLVGGGVLLYLGAEWLVRGSAGIARSLGMKPIVVGLTVVAYGTSMPELAVSGLAAWEGSSAIALGNVVGSNIANLGFILGVTALISPPKVEGGLMQRELPVLAFTSLLVPVVLWDGVIDRVEGGLLLVGAFVFSGWMLRSARGLRVVPLAEGPAESPPSPTGKLVVLSVLGLAALIVGGKLLVDGAVGLATRAGISERVVGLTIVAIGTSLPELAASLVAALRGHSGIAVGNVIGSNIFNVLFILGGAAAIRPVGGSLSDLALELSVLLGMTVLGMLSMRSARAVSRVEGAILIVAYAAFLVYLAVGGPDSSQR